MEPHEDILLEAPQYTLNITTSWKEFVELPTHNLYAYHH